MNKVRLETFSDGVIAIIIITIMVLEMKVPHGVEWTDLQELTPIFLSYILSFIYIGIYWNNHHHMLHAANKVNGKILWANLHLLFWLSLIPFVTGWMGENNFATLPVALYGSVLFMTGLAYFILARCLVSHHGSESPLAVALGRDRKGLISIMIYSAAIPITFINSMSALILYVVVALIWIIPDRRIEKGDRN